MAFKSNKLLMIHSINVNGMVDDRCPNDIWFPTITENVMVKMKNKPYGRHVAQRLAEWINKT